MTLTFADPAQVWLPIAATSQARTWQRSQALAAPSARWSVYLNQLCLNAVLSWVRETYNPEAVPWPTSVALPSFWSIVDGSAITLGATRIVVIPSETIDLSELRVPQEWVDILPWAADYYLGVQVNPDDLWVRIWGYTTHQHLKQAQYYDASDRTYCLAETDLITDLTVLTVARHLCPEEPTRAALSELPPLSLAQANHLLQRLSSPTVAVPRWTVPFEQWGALLAHGGWRQRLYEQRQGLPEQWSILHWLQNQVSEVAQQVGWQPVEARPGLVGARGAAAVPATALLRPLTILDQPYELWILPQGIAEDRIWRLELRAATAGHPIPRGFRLRILSEDLQPFPNHEAIATAPVERLYVEVRLEPGEGLVWEIEPTPTQWDREILRF